jgi:hypothetical protein
MRRLHNPFLGVAGLCGYGRSMSEPADAERDQDRIESRAQLLPEEQHAGSDDPEAQAEAILSESDDRTDRPAETQQESTQTPD